MNVLLIGSEDACSSGSQERQLEYAKLLSNYFIVERGKRNGSPKDTKPADNLFIFHTLSINKISFIYDAFQLGSRICEEQKIDCISCQDPFSSGLVGYFLKRKYKIPLNIHILADVIDNDYFISERKSNYFLNKLGKLVIQKADTVRVSTLKEKEKLAKLGIKDKKIWYIPFFINFDLFLKKDGRSIRKQYLTDKFDRLVLYVGRLARQKNLETLIQAAPFIIREYPKILFLIIGTGPEEKKIKNLVLNLGVKNNICFLGNISYDKIPNFFSACDLFVTTSLYEGTNMTLLEAAASGKPVISTSHAGAYDAILDGQTGYLVDFGDSAKVAEKILYLIAKPQLAEDIGKRGREFVLERFNKDKILKDYVKMWEETISYRNKTSGTLQKNKLWLTMFLKQLGILTYAKKIKRNYLPFVLRKRYIKFYIKPNIRKLENPPLSYIFEPTFQCNLNCNFCYEKDLKKEIKRELKKEMSLGQIRQVFNTLKLNDQVVNLTGGEIFTREDIFEILEYFKERNAWTYIVTNGTLFEEDIVNNLLKYNIRGIGFSLDGPENVHNQIRNSKDAFERVIKAIKLTKDRFRVGVNCAIQEKNINSLIEVALITYNLKIKELDFQLEIFTTSEALEDTRQILGWDSLPVSLQLKPNSGYDFPVGILEAKWNEVKKIGRRLGMDINIYPLLFDRHIKICAQRRLRDSNLRLICAGLLDGRIDPYGNVIPCYIIRKSFGNLLESSFEKIWNSPDFREFRYKMATNNLLPICENCCKLSLI